MADRARAALVTELRREGVSDQRVLAAIDRVPRERFVLARDLDRAYDNMALPIGRGQTISQPLVVAMMAQAAAIPQRGGRVLEVGTGSGYGAAVLAELAERVVSIERLPALAGLAATRLVRLGYTNVQVVVGDGSLGWPAEAPYDAIVVTAAAPSIPTGLIAQLRPDGGRLVVPVGDYGEQELMVVIRQHERHTTRSLGPVRFVPLVGQAGWSDTADGET